MQCHLELRCQIIQYLNTLVFLINGLTTKRCDISFQILIPTKRCDISFQILNPTVCNSQLATRNLQLATRTLPCPIRVSNDFDPDSGPTLCNCLQRLSAGDKSPASMQRVNVSIIRVIAFRRQTKVSTLFAPNV